ncbi:MAG: hybrid sensor histidine kinase/response regulator [Bacteroidales bacterium]|nr:hybrid sensor histidine kinase/response regulator [Bacteroidales bacterium]
METLKILIVDDEAGIRTGIHRVLQNYTVSFPFYEDDFDFEIIDAETGEEAMSIIDNDKVDIILLDNKLPGIEGIEVLEYINRMKTDVAVMMITSHASIELAIKATNNGAYNFIPKPFSAQDIKSAIESITKHLFLKRMTRRMKAEAKQVRFKFLSVLSHELKSPINAVEGYLRIMKDKQAGDDIGAYEKMIDRSLTRLDAMRGLIMDMLDFTKIESGTKSRSLVDLDIVEIARLSVDSIYPVAIQKNIKIISDFPENLIMKADTGEIEIIFNNLLSNAVKYNKENGSVNFTIRKGKESVYAVIEDTGIGMNDEERSMLFNEFTRFKTDKTKNISGSGLGLSIMKRVIDLNKGKVTVESEPDVGSKFTVELPKNSSYLI